MQPEPTKATVRRSLATLLRRAAQASGGPQLRRPVGMGGAARGKKAQRAGSAKTRRRMSTRCEAIGARSCLERVCITTITHNRREMRLAQGSDQRRHTSSLHTLLAAAAPSPSCRRAARAAPRIFSRSSCSAVTRAESSALSCAIGVAEGSAYCTSTFDLSCVSNWLMSSWRR